MSGNKIILSICCVLLAFIYMQYEVVEEIEHRSGLSKMMEAWQSIIIEPHRSFSKVAIGTNACVDLIVSGVPVLEALSVEPGEQRDHNIITTLHDLQEVFHHHFDQGAGGERFFADGDLFRKVIEYAAMNPKAQWYIGGNAALMAQKMAVNFPNVQLELIGPIGPRLKELLHHRIAVPASSLTPSDEIHLIMEYSVGEKWGESVAPVATRFITSHDMANSEAKSLEDFFEGITENQPDLVVLSGLHMMEGQPSAVWGQRLAVTGEGLLGIGEGTAVHLELASMANVDLVRQITVQLLPKVSSLGLNEQELGLLSQVMGGPHSDIFDSQGHPEIHKVTDIITWLLQTYGRGNHDDSRLARVHFHTLTFHILAVTPGSWENVASAVAAGSRAASHQACDTDTLDEHLIELRIPLEFTLHSDGAEQVFDADRPVTSFSNKGFQFAFSPVLVCKKPLKTVGLGDAISATGLMFSIFNKDKL